MNAAASFPAAHRWAWRAIGIGSLALVAAAVWVQLALHEDPCPLCIIQRYVFLAIAAFAFTASAGGRRAPLWRVLALAAALTGAAVAARHIYVQAHPSFSCGFDALEPVVDGLPPAHWVPVLFKVAGLCETAYPPILGLTLPMWALVFFAAIALTIGWGLRARTAAQAA
ncbi:disulfide bond formation protein B [Trinickia dabaoshanensis]|uniref:Disulfide bond formation protein B n=1 Tax=Trinickia dabaoshanensis TaxID=564714 RepID=A0A2N7W1E3_9BURK|nr:disulfide bond formation protein B [Trinickia dabaoshanensis]PMS23202.1 disulfide bond formation protein B [Trinickia dabaoshanensis]